MPREISLQFSNISLVWLLYMDDHAPVALEELKKKVWEGERISSTEARCLYDLPLAELGNLAHRRRLLAKRGAYNGCGNEIVTFIIDRNINYTNICDVYCKFCAFYRLEKDPDSYVISWDEMNLKLRETVEAGGTQILLQGGHHPKLSIEWYLDLLSKIKVNYPKINIHAFSPSEFVHFRQVFKKPLEEILSAFMKAGLGSIPGGGGEILVDEVRNKVSPRKANTEEWLEVMKIAHQQGLKTSATMMFGHVETVENRIEHLMRLRELQDKTHGFTAFIAWTFQAENTRLRAQTVGSHEYLRTLALSRIFLDNFENLQSSWVTQGPEIGQVALQYGANDLGSVMLEENVVSKAGTCHQMGVIDMRRLIEDAGYKPRQRDNWYNLL